MRKFSKSQILMLTILAALLFVTPFLSSSLRPKYVYFIVNLLILAVGADAGLFPRLSKPLEDKKHAVPVTSKPVITSPAEASSPEAKVTLASSNENKQRVIEKSVSEKIVSTVKANEVVKCPSMPSLFYIGSGETEAEELTEDDEVQEEVGGLSGQELYNKAETFIGNFYNQLKMQREDSWRRIHGLSHKAF
uniref:DUF4408 domain-containing protein n=1 Tax=Rhizophora mucronata TaxID=61149 RepID=A0A2P2PNK2_RHIMU